MVLTFNTITYVLGSHFNCPPHSWDDQPVERVYLDYLMVKSMQEIQSKEQEKIQKESRRYNATGNRNKGRPIRTTSDAADLGDYFDRINTDMRVD